jgi:type II restriction/modification system DNA methylase subunit YeeA
MARNRPSGALRRATTAARVVWSAWRIQPSTPQTRRTLQEWVFTQEKPMPLSLAEFVTRWKASTLTERAAAQSHFIDLCEVLRQPNPAAADQTGDAYTFEKHVSLTKGGKGFADVWKRQFFGWEYKGKHKDLNAAYLQLNDYREDLENPPLLVVCDLERFEVHTNFTGTRPHVYRFTLDDLLSDAPTATCAIPPLEVLRDAFTDPEQLRPEHAAARVTEAAATEFAKLAVSLEERNTDAQAVAHFLMRLLFCLFADSIGLLPDHIFRQMIELDRAKPASFTRKLRQLFAAMSSPGNSFGVHDIHWFNGGLFADDTVFDLTSADMGTLRAASALDWSTVEPAIFGTLFERSLDPRKRSQLGAHYTSKQDILLIVEPVVIAPLQARWQAVKAEVTALAEAAGKQRKGASYNNLRAQMQEKLSAWLEALSKVRILDPACGSGNFLYLALRRMLDLWREAYLFSAAHGLPALMENQVHPSQLYGLETNIYAHELASVVVWIGYLQWLNDHGIGWPTEPILRKLDNIQHRDAILTHDADGKPVEPAWPEADFIIGNPPFLGGKQLRTELGDEYVNSLYSVYEGRIAPQSDLVTYWFEKARARVEAKVAKRVGLLATQGIRGGINRQVLERIKSSGDIFMAWGDKEWSLDGAAVHVSLIGFDGGYQTERLLDGHSVKSINADLTDKADTTTAFRLKENANLCFRADEKGGPFDIENCEAQTMLTAPVNVNGRPNSDVLCKWVNASDITGRSRGKWIIDFDGKTLEQAADYERPFEYLTKQIERERLEAAANGKETKPRDRWWLHRRPGTEMREAVAELRRYIGTIATGKYRPFVWLDHSVLPDHQLYIFARDDDYFFGVLHSHLHEVWARAQGTQLREVESGFRYTPTSTFETYPFPWPPNHEPKDSPLVEAIAEAARELVAKRDAWLNPPDANSEELKKRTLTNLYNARPSWLAEAHRKLDAAVFAAYGWPVTLTDAELLERLLALNHERAAASQG